MKDTFLKIFKTKFYTTIFLLFALVFVGVIGFKIVSDYSWIDAFYMTIITITTVGFGEVHPLDDTAKIFTILLILAGVVILGYALSIITEYILSKNTIEEIKQKKNAKIY